MTAGRRGAAVGPFGGCGRSLELHLLPERLDVRLERLHRVDGLRDELAARHELVAVGGRLLGDARHVLVHLQVQVRTGPAVLHRATPQQHRESRLQLARHARNAARTAPCARTLASTRWISARSAAPSSAPAAAAAAAVRSWPPACSSSTRCRSAATSAAKLCSAPSSLASTAARSCTRIRRAVAPLARPLAWRGLASHR